jgi:transcriptional regulator with XRE-family HTH domain
MPVTRQNITPRRTPLTALKAARLVRGFAIEDVAEVLGFSVSSLIRWERSGKVPQSRVHLDALIDFYGVPYEELWPPLERAA